MRIHCKELELLPQLKELQLSECTSLSLFSKMKCRNGNKTNDVLSSLSYGTGRRIGVLSIVATGMRTIPAAQCC